tara:strand:+ start:307 stop:1122 length:816 start_codon:yes stop_codon:yes gene_type:complete
MKDFSVGVVMSFWDGDDPFQFEEAIQSILNQTRVPNKFVIVQDGPVRINLKNIIDKFANNPIIDHIIIPTNKGRGNSRHAGVLKCDCAVVALMDADDISENTRIEKQVKFLKRNESIDIVGGYIQEIDGENENIFRTVPLSHNDILKKGRFSQPFNHVTIMFKKDIYTRSGGYSFFKIMEDYEYFHRLYLAGAKFANIPEVLVKVRTNGQLCRRQGYKYFREEFLLQLIMYKSRYINFSTMMRNICMRFLFRSLPGRIQSFITRKLLRESN